MKIFITGATGFLGQYLLKELSPFCSTIYVLSRKTNHLVLTTIPNVKIIKGDITNHEIIESEADRELISEEVDLVVHAAALYDVEANHSECYLQNVVGTQNVLRTISKIKKLKAFYYISTIAVGDDQSYLLEEDQLPQRTQFKDHYSESKYSAELLVRDISKQFCTRIIRPGIIVGDSKTGKMDKIDGPYYFIRALRKFRKVLSYIPYMPVSYNPNTKIPLIPVDHCARFISILIKRDQFIDELKTYHLISAQIPTIKEFLDDLNQNLNLQTKYIPVAQNKIHNSLFNLLGIPKQQIPFMFSHLSYDMTRTKEELPELEESRYSVYSSKLFGNSF